MNRYALLGLLLPLAVPARSQDAASGALRRAVAQAAGDDRPMAVGLGVLDEHNRVGRVGRSFSNGLVEVSYCPMSDIPTRFVRPATLARQVRSVDGFSVGDWAVNQQMQDLQIVRLFSNGVAAVRYSPMVRSPRASWSTPWVIHVSRLARITNGPHPSW